MIIADMSLDISIHAPREGSDAPDFAREDALAQISIHAPREGSDRSTVW